MKKMNKKGFTLVELLAVIVILAILMAIAATNIGPVIDNSRRSSMRTTAQQIIDAVRLQLTSNYELFPGMYGFTEAILDSGGVSAPFGGDYAYYKPDGSKDKIGSGVYALNTNEASSANDCAASHYSYVVIARTEETYTWTICLTTKDHGEDKDSGYGQAGGYLFATRNQLDDKEDDTIYHGRAAISNASESGSGSGTNSGTGN